MEDVLRLVQNSGGAKQLMSRYIQQDPDERGFVTEKVFRLALFVAASFNITSDYFGRTLIEGNCVLNRKMLPNLVWMHGLIKGGKCGGIVYILYL